MVSQEHNCATGEITLRDLTAKEISDREKQASAFLAEKEATARAKAELLARLGITAEEAQLLLS